MATSLYNLLKEYKIVIPIIQRDYAQGREIGKVPKIRDRFLNALFTALKENKEPLELDFVYGYTKVNQNSSEKNITSFVPLDGQQRLTTLFLLHWYTAVKENHLEEAKEHLSKFTYETRHSSRVFCNELIEFVPDELNRPIKETIINQPWFFTAWKNDPTISSMLTMLNAIQEKINLYGLKNIWSSLTSEQPKIVFHLLPMEKLGLPDDLYIKMNSRGKELTDFEYFKSQFSEILPKHQSVEFNKEIDQSWSDLFWKLYKDEEDIDIAKLVDNGFLRFFYYITDMLVYKNDIEIELSFDDFNNYRKLYEIKENVEFLFSSFNVLCATFLSNDSFFDELFYTEESDFNENKTRLFFHNAKNDLFKKCADNYDASFRVNPFSIGEQLLLYACILHLVNNSSDFNTRLRKLRNLVANSEDTVRKENMPSLLKTVSEIILNNHIDDDSKFNTKQIDEEVAKQSFIENNNALKETINKLEDHHLLQGCLAVFKLDADLPDYSKEFINVFSSENQYDAISRSLLCFGDYSQKYAWRRRFGNHNNSVWRELLTPSQRRADFQKTRAVLYFLLTHLIQNPQSNLQDIISDYLDIFEKQSDKPKDWKYYFIKYQEFRKNEDGFYYWKDMNNQYESIMMRRSTLGGFHWFPFLYTLREKSENLVSLENYGDPLLLTINNATLKITNINIGYKIEAYDDNDDSKEFFSKIIEQKIINSSGIFEIVQNADGIDVEDRIEKGTDFIKGILSKYTNAQVTQTKNDD